MPDTKIFGPFLLCFWAFQGKLGLARTVYPYVEDHNFYIEHWTMSVVWRKVRELGATLAKDGLLGADDDPILGGRCDAGEPRACDACGAAHDSRKVVLLSTASRCRPRTSSESYSSSVSSLMSSSFIRSVIVLT